MADPTPEQLVMELVRRFYPEVKPGYRGRRYQIALAAIIETSEMAAKLNDEYESFIRLGSVGDAATALRAYDHIKPENG